ncbi:acyl carrier protein [Paenibacillus sp. sgz500958]|uniref:acyl carrier protein n=1 Tax=Paenibacillus sp. sgz500958 TaxID=3242475 RepID=UPI0036D3C080
MRILSEIKNNPELLLTATETTDIVNDVGLDSLQMINFILRIEDEFEIEFDFDHFAYEDFKSIGDFMGFITATQTAF